MGTVAEDNVQILISKLRDSLEGSDILWICNVLDRIKNKEPDNEVKNDLKKIAGERGCGKTLIEMIKDYDGNILLLVMQVIKKLLKPA